MKVILLQNVPNAGKVDEVKEVSEGYARNFLFPRHLAVQASAKALQDRSAHKVKLKKDIEKELQREQAVAARLDGFEIVFKEKASDKGALYAAVTATKIAEQLGVKGFVVDKDAIKLKPIKECGTFPATVVMGHGLEAHIHITVSKI